MLAVRVMVVHRQAFSMVIKASAVQAGAALLLLLLQQQLIETSHRMLTFLQVLLVLGSPFMVELCCFGVIHPYPTQLTPVHGVALPVLQQGMTAYTNSTNRQRG